VFGFELAGETVGTVRVVPLGHGLTLTETLFAQLGEAAPAIAPGDWEVGRLVLAPEYRSDVDALRHCLLTSLRYGCSHSPIAGLYATCTHALSRLYRRFGFTAFAHGVPLPGTAKTYTMIKADCGPLLATLSGQGGGRPH
jgi:N-acyl-L-homoserine lactone synthetase